MQDIPKRASKYEGFESYNPSRWLFAIGILLSCFPMLPLIFNSDSALLQGDFVSKMVPSKLVWLNSMIESGRPPFWNQYIFAGTPYWSDIGGGVLYPFNLILLFFSKESIFNGIAWYVLLHFPFTFLGMWLCLRDLNISPTNRAGFSLAYCLSGIVFSSISYRTQIPGFMMMPFMVYFTRTWLRKDHSPWSWHALGLAIVLALGVYGSAVEFTTMAAFLISIAVLFRGSKLQIIQLCFLGLLALLYCAPQLLPGAELLLNSKRADGINDATLYSGYAFHPVRWAELFYPFPFGTVFPNFQYWGPAASTGVQPLYLSVYLGSTVVLGFMGYILRFRSKPFVKYLFLFALLLMSMSYYLPVNLFAIVREFVPIMKPIRYSEKVLVPITFCLVLFSAIGWQSIFIRDSNQKKKTLLLCVLFTLLIALAARVFIEVDGRRIDFVLLLQSSLLVIAQLLLFLFLLPRIPVLWRWRGVFLLLIVAMDLGVHARNLIWPQPLNSLSQPLAKVIQNDIQGEGAQSIQGGGAYRYTSIFLKKVNTKDIQRTSIAENTVLYTVEQQVSRISPSIGVFFNLHDISGAGAMTMGPRLNFFHKLAEFDPNLAVDFLSVRYIGNDIEASTRYRAAVNQDALPYLFVPKRVRYVSSREEVLEQVQAEPELIQTTAWIEAEGHQGGKNGRLIIESFTRVDDGEIRIRVRSNGISEPTYLQVQESFTRHWQAYVNGIPNRVLLANGWAMAIRVKEDCSKGCEILLRYENPLISYGFLFLLLGLVLTFLLYFAFRNKGLQSIHSIREKSIYLGYLKDQIRRDGSIYKVCIFENMLKASPLVSNVYKISSMHPVSRAIVCSIYYLYRYLAIQPNFLKKSVVVAPVFKNEKRILAEELDSTIRNEWASYHKHKKFIPINILLIWPLLKGLFGLPFAYRQSLVLSRHVELFRGMRAAEFYAYFRAIAPAIKRAKMIIVTTDGNPNGMALFALGECYRTTTIFLSHGEPIPPMAKLRAKMAYLLGQHSADVYREHGTRFEELLFQGHKDFEMTYTPLSEAITTVGLFIGKLDQVERLRETIHLINSIFDPQRILLRQHPNFPLNGGTVSQLQSGNLEISEEASIFKDIHRCDLMVIGDSTSHLQVLLCGKPSLYYFDGDQRFYDRYNYLRDGLVMEISESVSMNSINEFYGKSKAAFSAKVGYRLALSQTQADARAALLRWLQHAIHGRNS